MHPVGALHACGLNCFRPVSLWNGKRNLCPASPSIVQFHSTACPVASMAIVLVFNNSDLLLLTKWAFRLRCKQPACTQHTFNVEMHSIEAKVRKSSCMHRSFVCTYKHFLADSNCVACWSRECKPHGYCEVDDADCM